VTKQGSTWLIFTESKKWVIEFTNDKTLWFNFNLFQGELDLIGKDCVEEKDLIKNWFESRFLGIKPVEDTIQNGVKETTPSGYLGSIEMKGKIVHQIESPKQNNEVEDAIQNGVKDTHFNFQSGLIQVEDVIQNGVRHTNLSVKVKANQVEDTIQNGVKETKENRLIRTISVISTIKNGVKHVEDGDWLDQDERIDDIIENGVKETKEISNISLMSEIFKVKAKQTIRDGVKELKVWKSNRCEEHGYFELVDGIPTYTPMTQVKDVLENGVKEIQPLPARDGNRDWGLYYQRQGNLTKPHTEYVKEVIEDSYNHMGRVEGVIRNTDKDGI
jgi:hypothetical protein